MAMYELIHPSKEASRSGVVGIRLTGELTSEDYDCLAPHLEEKAKAQGPLRVLVMEDWEG